MSKKSIGLFLIVVLALASCSKEPIFKSKEKNVSSEGMKKISSYENPLDLVKERDGMLVFESIEHFFEATEAISKLDDIERLAFEERFNFGSFGTIADNFYRDINFDDLKDKEQLENFVKEHSQVLELEYSNDDSQKLPEGEENLPVLLPANFYDSERWLMNKDKMYIIDDAVYKHFNNGKIVIALAKDVNIELLKKAEPNDWSKFLKQENFKVYSYDVNNDVKQSFPDIYFPDQPTPPNNIKKIERIGYDGKGKYRVRVIMNCGVYRHFGWFVGPNGHYIRLKTTLINERKGKIFFFITKWYNTGYETKGYIKINTRHNQFNPVSGRYDDFTFTPCEDIDINYNIKDITWTRIISFCPVPPVGVHAKKPWIRIVGWDIDLSVSNGAYLYNSY